MQLQADKAKEMKMVSKGAELRAQHADLDRLVVLCQSELSAVQVWLFGSRARGDHHANSDFDILAILPDDAPDAAEDPITAFLLRRRSGLHADLLVVRLTDFEGARDTVNTISFIVHREGVRLDV